MQRHFCPIFSSDTEASLIAEFESKFQNHERLKIEPRGGAVPIYVRRWDIRSDDIVERVISKCDSDAFLMTYRISQGTLTMHPVVKSTYEKCFELHRICGYLQIEEDMYPGKHNYGGLFISSTREDDIVKQCLATAFNFNDSEIWNDEFSNVPHCNSMDECISLVARRQMWLEVEPEPLNAAFFSDVPLDPEDREFLEAEFPWILANMK